MRHLAGKLVLPCLMFSVTMLKVGWGRAQGLTSPTADEIVARMVVKNAERQAALEHYVSERTYRVEYKGTGGEHFGEIVVHAEYSAPNHKKFTVVSEAGSKLICEKVLRRLVEGEQEATQESIRMQTMLSAENYNVELVGAEQVDGFRAWVLKVSPKVNTKFTYRGKVWVSEDDFAVMRVHGEPAKNPSWWINRTSFDSRFVRRGEFWLPGKNVSTSYVRIGGEATLTIDYGEYQTLAGKAVGSAEEVSAGVAGSREAQLVGGKVGLATLPQ